ncbi:unnamed protein product [Bathycoccus prasinos]
MKGFLSKLNLRGRKQNDDDAADENNTNNTNRQKRKQRKTAQKIREKQAHAIERSANSVRAISGLASGSMRLLPNKNGKKPISTKTNVQGMVVGLAALGVARSMAERSVVAKKKKKRKEGVSSEEEEEEEDEEEEKRARRTTNGTTVKFAAMMATFIVKPVTFTGAFVLREVYRSALALLGETNKDDGSSSSLKNSGGESVLMTPSLTPKTPRSSRQSVNSSHDDDEDEDVGKSASDATKGDTNKCCSNCGVKIANALRCARCRQTCYCSQECQKSEWNEHKKTCVPSPELLENTRRANEEVREATVNWDGTFQASTSLFQAVKHLTKFAKRCGDAKSSGDALWISLILFANEIDSYGEIKREDGWRDVTFDQHLETCEAAARIVMRSEFLEGSSNEGDSNSDSEEARKAKKARARALARLALGTCALRGAKRSTKIALENFYDAREDAVRCKCPFLAAEACRRICSAHLHTGNFSSASIAIQQAVEFAKLVAEKQKKENATNETTTMYYYYRLFHADIHESLEVCVWLEHLKSSREYFGKNNTTPREPSERAHFLAKDDSYLEKKRASNLKTVAIGEALLKREELENGDNEKSERVKQTVYFILAETYHELNETKKCEACVQKIHGGAGNAFKCAYCDERVVLSIGEEMDEGQGTSVLPWQMEYRTCINPRSPHIFHTKCAHGLKAPHRKKHEACACCQLCRDMTQLTQTPTKSASRTGSSASLELRNGRLVAIAHHIPKTGYKAINSYGHKPRFVSETTSKTAQKACFAAPAKKTTSKPLQKYHPWAARNRPKQFTENVVGRRFGFTSMSASSKETYRGSSQVCLGDKSIKNTFQTTNRAFQQVSVNSRSSKEKSLAMMTNQGIASDVAKRLHAKLMPKPELETTF